MNLQNFRQLKIGVETPIYVMLMGMLAIQIATPWRVSAIMSLGTWMIIISIMISFFLALITRKIDNLSLAMLAALAVFLCVSVILSFSLKYQNLVAALSFLEIPLVMTTYSRCRDKNVRRAIYVSFIFLSIYYQIISFTSVANIYYTEYGSKQMKFLTLGYDNPNETAMHLLVCFFVLMIFLGELKNIFAKIFLIADIVMILRLVFLTMSRTSYLVVIFFVIVYIFFKKIPLPRFTELIFFCLPLVFVIITYLFRVAGIDISFLGETFDTGRVDIYTSVFENFDILIFLFGKYDFLFSNLHNGFVSIFATIGIIGVIAFYVFLYIKIRSIRNYIDDRFTQKMAFVGLLCMVAYTSTEAAFLTAGGTFAVAFLSVYFIGAFSKEETVDSKTF